MIDAPETAMFVAFVVLTARHRIGNEGFRTVVVVFAFAHCTL
jgi:hypothetical protein